MNENYSPLQKTRIDLSSRFKFVIEALVSLYQGSYADKLRGLLGEGRHCLAYYRMCGVNQELANECGVALHLGHHKSAWIQNEKMIWKKIIPWWECNSVNDVLTRITRDVPDLDRALLSSGETEKTYDQSYGVNECGRLAACNNGTYIHVQYGPQLMRESMDILDLPHNSLDKLDIFIPGRIISGYVSLFGSTPDGIVARSQTAFEQFLDLRNNNDGVIDSDVMALGAPLVSFEIKTLQKLAAKIRPNQIRTLVAKHGVNKHTKNTAFETEILALMEEKFTQANWMAAPVKGDATYIAPDLGLAIAKYEAKERAKNIDDNGEPKKKKIKTNPPTQEKLDKSEWAKYNKRNTQWLSHTKMLMRRAHYPDEILYERGNGVYGKDTRHVQITPGCVPKDFVNGRDIGRASISVYGYDDNTANKPIYQFTMDRAPFVCPITSLGAMTITTQKSALQHYNLMTRYVFIGTLSYVGETNSSIRMAIRYSYETGLDKAYDYSNHYATVALNHGAEENHAWSSSLYTPLSNTPKISLEEALIYEDLSGADNVLSGLPRDMDDHSSELNFLDSSDDDDDETAHFTL